MKKKLDSILMVDDSIADNYLHKIVIIQSNVTNHIGFAENGVEALEYLNNEGKFSIPEENPTPDLIFLDINMPKMNGFEFLDEYQKLDESLRSKIHVVMLTTSNNPKDREKSLSYEDVKGFFCKPLTIDLLNKVYQDVIASSRSVEGSQFL